MTVIINGDTGISGVNGSAANPAIKGSDADTGIHFGANQVDVSTGGVTRLNINTAGNATFTGDVSSDTVLTRNIANPMTPADGGIAIDNNGHVQLDGLQIPTAGAIGNRSLLMNGEMLLAQRGTSIDVTEDNTFLLDRWRVFHAATNTDTVTMSQSDDVPTGSNVTFTKSLKLEVTSGAATGASNYTLLAQPIEGFDSHARLKLGTADAIPFTLSFWVRSNHAGTYAVTFRNSNGTSHYIFSYTITADTWTYVTHTIPATTTGTFTSDNTKGLELMFSIDIGTSFHGTANTWSVNGQNLFGLAAASNDWTDTTGNTFEITGCQLEAGSLATPFEKISRSLEQSRCERYYQKYVYSGGGIIGQGICWTTTNATFSFDFRNEMRAAPTISLPPAGTAAGQIAYLQANGNFPTTIGAHNAGAISTINFALTGSGYAGLAGAGMSSWLYQGGTSGTTIQASAEL